MHVVVLEICTHTRVRARMSASVYVWTEVQIFFLTVTVVIIGSHQEKGGHMFWNLAQRLPLQENPIVAWKFCHVMHKLLRDGHHHVCNCSHYEHDTELEFTNFLFKVHLVSLSSVKLEMLLPFLVLLECISIFLCYGRKMSFWLGEANM